MTAAATVNLPGLDCGLCGFRTCADLAVQLERQPGLLERCIHLTTPSPAPAAATLREEEIIASAGHPSTATRPSAGLRLPVAPPALAEPTWLDSLGREFDFYLEHFPEEPGPREIILPHNPLITRELNVQVGDLLIGRPLGMSCGCPITHCGVVMNTDVRTGVIDWCVTGPLQVRQQGFKDLGYYIAEGYEGLIRQARCEVRIGMRYFFQPRMCMLQWRHSGLVNYLNRTADGWQVRLEGLWIG